MKLQMQWHPHCNCNALLAGIKDHLNRTCKETNQQKMYSIRRDIMLNKLFTAEGKCMVHYSCVVQEFSSIYSMIQFSDLLELSTATWKSYTDIASMFFVYMTSFCAALKSSSVFVHGLKGSESNNSKKAEHWLFVNKFIPENRVPNGKTTGIVKYSMLPHFQTVKYNPKNSTPKEKSIAYHFNILLQEVKNQGIKYFIDITKY